MAVQNFYKTNPQGCLAPEDAENYYIGEDDSNLYDEELFNEQLESPSSSPHETLFDETQDKGVTALQPGACESEGRTIVPPSEKLFFELQSSVVGVRGTPCMLSTTTVASNAGGKSWTFANAIDNILNPMPRSSTALIPMR